MICPSCKKRQFIVVRTITEGSMVIRHRACECGYRAKTVEVADLDSNTRTDPIHSEADARV